MCSSGFEYSVLVLALLRSRDALSKFKPAQPSPQADFPQLVPMIQKPVERVIGFFQKDEPDRNIIPPPLHEQLRKATAEVPVGPGMKLSLSQYCL